MSMTGLDESKDASKSPQAQLEAVPLWDLRRELIMDRHGSVEPTHETSRTRKVK